MCGSANSNANPLVWPSSKSTQTEGTSPYGPKRPTVPGPKVSCRTRTPSTIQEGGSTSRLGSHSGMCRVCASCSPLVPRSARGHADERSVRVACPDEVEGTVRGRDPWVRAGPVYLVQPTLMPMSVRQLNSGARRPGSTPARPAASLRWSRRGRGTWMSSSYRLSQRIS